MADNMPSILLTRPAPDAAQFAAALRARLGAVEIVHSPLLRIEFAPTPILSHSMVPIFTSRNGVEGFVRAGGRASGACWCVGEATAQAAQAAGFTARAAKGDAESLLAAILASGDKGPFQHYRGAHARADLAGRLAAAGRPTGAEVVYTQHLCDLSAKAKAVLNGETAVIVPLFSPRTAKQFARVHAGSAALFVAVISDAVGAELNKVSMSRVETAARPDAAAMLDATARLFGAALRLERGPGAK